MLMAPLPAVIRPVAILAMVLAISGCLFLHKIKKLHESDAEYKLYGLSDAK
jgi:hypothetical protein